MRLMALDFRHGKTSSNRSDRGGSGPPGGGGSNRPPATAGSAGGAPARALSGQLGSNRRRPGRRAGDGPSPPGSISRAGDAPAPLRFGLGRMTPRLAVGGPGNRFRLPVAEPGPGRRIGGAFGQAGRFGETVGASGGPRSILATGPTASLAQGRSRHSSSQE